MTFAAAQLREESLRDPANREVVMACGAALEHAQCALERSGHFVDVVPFPAGGADAVVAQMHAFPRDEAWPAASHTAIAPSGQGLLQALRDAARREHAWVDAIVDDCRRVMVVDALTRAAAPAVALGAPQPPRALLPMLAALGCVVDVPSAATAAEARGRLMDADALVVLGVQRDEPTHWLNGGRVLYRLLLLAEAAGVRAALTTSPLDRPMLRDALRPLLFAGGVPLLVMSLTTGGLEQETGNR